MARRANRGETSLRAAIGGISGVVLILLLAPTLVVVIVSFTSGFSLKFPPPGYSLRWYAALADAWQLQFAARNSLQIAIVTTVLTVSAGVPAALRSRDRGAPRRGLSTASSCRPWCCRRSPSDWRL